ncbi:MAG: 5-formyltetrahydrofolate cyclo-ligase [Clostridiaceae bacterium]|nr:5-formyltetrahydrofolate cyclo-ligase [Clostridiaceae bacterium]
MNKKELRKIAKERRDQLTREQVVEYTEAILKKLLNHPWYLGCNTLFTYVSIGNEVGTHALIESAFSAGKRVCVPRVNPGEDMVAVPIRSIAVDLKMGFYNIPKPRKELQPVSEKLVDLVIVPGLLFDRDGYRIGYGGGYYDKYLQRLPASGRTIGLAFRTQIVDLLPREAYDQKVMHVITED